MPKKYGLPYKGSKSRLADRIFALMPSGETFVDLFAGGCAMTHAAIKKGFTNIICNDITDIPQVFVGALEGKYDNEDRWISREDFFALKDTDPYVRLVWSFGNNLRTYLYGKPIAPYKKALHWAVYYQDAEPLKKYGIDVSEAVKKEDRYERWPAVKRAVTAFMSGGQESPPSQADRLQHEERRARLSAINYHHWEDTLRLQQNEATNVLRSISISYPPPNLRVTQLDYQAVEIPQGAVVYADPPYKGTEGYTNKFDHERFYQWLRTRDFPVYVSEYAMPSDFICIGEFAHNVKFSAQSNNKTIERVFIHEKFKDKVIATSLF